MKTLPRYAVLLALSLVIAWSAFVSTAQELSQPIYEVIEELDVKVEMRDGVRLSTNIYRPNAEGKFPVILKRTPYNKGNTGNPQGHYWASRGYIFVSQDCRGRVDSEGVSYAFINEAADGLDTQEWGSKQTWCNGNIGTTGGSYVGATQWLPALEGSRYVDAMYTKITTTDYYSFRIQNGAFFQMLTGLSISRSAPYAFDLKTFNETKLDSVFKHIPLIEQDTVIGWRIPYLRDVYAHPERDSYWKPLSNKGKFRHVKTPVYNLGGWYDLFTAQSFKSFTEMTKESISEDIRSKQKIIVGPWAHGGFNKSVLGDLDFGTDSAIIDGELQLRWFDHHLKGIDTGIMDEPPVKIFVMGDNVWRYENEWPLARTQYTKYYLHSNGHANTKDGDGRLSVSNAGDEPPDMYSYDPDDPVQSQKHLPIDHSAVEDRNDILVYTTEPLENDLEVTGPVNITLYASSSAKTTDFTGKLLDVYPDGRAIYICDGIIRSTHRNGPVNTSFIEPGKIYEYSIDLWATSNVFKKGHRIRVEISSSNFPRFDRNLGTALNNALATEMVKAEQTIYHDREHPSCIVLPVIPR